MRGGPLSAPPAPPAAARQDPVAGWRSGVVATLALALTLAACGRGGEGVAVPLAPAAARGYNLLLITLDTTRADHLGCYGMESAATPVLDGLAREGLRFERALTPVPITLPSHATMLTGLLPPNHGIRDNAEYRLDGAQRTLAEILHDAGYETAAFVSAFVLESRYGLDRGFEVYDDREGFGTDQSVAGRILERPAAVVTRQAAAWLEARDDPGPFFLWVHYFDPHLPHQAPEPYASRFASSPYDAEIAYVDSQIGRLLQTLTRTGRRERTLIVVAGDHGEGLGEHGEETHAMLIYDSVMRVPLLVTGRGVVASPGVVRDGIVSTADILPTVLGLLDVSDATARDGLDLTRERIPAGRALYLESLTPYLHHGWSPLFALERLGDKYIEAPAPEYYDLVADPGETSNLAGGAQAEVAAHRDALHDRLGSLLADWPDYREAAAMAIAPDTETLERLRALGYVGGGPPSEPSLADPKDMMPVLQHIHRAGALLGVGKIQEALVEVEGAARLSPRDRTVLETQGAVYLLLGREREAEQVFRTFLDIRPSADVCAMLAQILVKDGRREEARALLDQAEALDPNHGVIHLTRGDMLGDEGRNEEAIASWRRAAECDPSLGRAVESRIAALTGRR